MTRLLIRIGFVFFASGLPFTAAAADIAELMAKGELAFSRGDVVDAMNWYRQAAELGHAPAQVRLGDFLDYSEQNSAAAEWFEKAAQQGDPGGAVKLARLYRAGEGVPKDEAKAIDLYLQAAEQDYPPAIHFLADAYEKGVSGLEADPARAVAFLERGVALGDQASIKRLARAYREGELGLPKDTEKARLLEERMAVKDK